MKMWRLMVKRMMDEHYRELSKDWDKKELRRSVPLAKDLFRGAKFRIVRE